MICDLDGTVWDSYTFYADAIADRDPAEHARALAQLRAAKPAATLLRSGGVTKARLRKICRSADAVPVYDGALPALRRLRGHGIPLGAVTNLPGWIALPLLACCGLDDMLQSVVTWERSRQRKPHPAPLALCCRELGVDIDERAWYVGDSAGSCHAALAAGMSFAWASWGTAPRSRPAATRR